MAIYFGVRTDEHGCAVFKYDGDSLDYLDPMNDVWNHSPDGFEWGYSGSGPAQLALALLIDACQNLVVAVDLHQRFKWEVVARMPEDAWALNSEDILVWAQTGKRPTVHEIVGFSLQDGGPFSVN